MYDFGFYLEHSVYFRDYLEKEFSGGIKISRLDDFDTIMKNFQQSATFANYFGKVDMVPAQPTNYLIAFGIRFDKVCDISLDKAISVLSDPRYGDHYRFTECTKNAAKGMTGGTYIWCFDDVVQYVGEADNLEKRLKNYSDISPYSVRKNQQTTNRHMNAEICKAVHSGKTVTMYFYPTEHHHDDVEQYLLHCDPKKQWFTLNKKI